MEKRGEITIFLSLILICVFSLLLGIVESARTAGARLYLQMAADSAADSLFSQYNRNLWDMYRLLFLECDDEKIVKEVYEEYLNFYLNQENLYPMKAQKIEILQMKKIQDQGAEALEDEIIAYIKYRLPDVAKKFSGITEIASEAATAGDFKSLLEVCRQAGRETRKLEKRRKKIEDCLTSMQKDWKEAQEALENEKEERFRRKAKSLTAEMRKFPGYVEDYEKELNNIKDHRETVGKQKSLEDPDADGWMKQEKTAYAGVEEAAEKLLEEYREMEKTINEQAEMAERALEILEITQNSEDEEAEPDWSGVESAWREIQIPEGTGKGEGDEEKAAALDRLEELLDMDLLSLVLPAGTKISGKQVNLKESPSELLKDTGGVKISPEVFLVNEYVFLYFNSFLGKTEESGLQGEHALAYEQEYLLGGKESDQENLKISAEQLLAVRGALNLLYLLASPEKKAAADSLAAAVSAGAAPVQFILSFFVLSLWAFGEAVVDVRGLLDGGKVEVWKSDRNWNLGLEELLSLQFVDESFMGNGEYGYDYEGYLRVLLLLKDRVQKNFRLMDLIQWNVKTVQADFDICSCIYEAELETEVEQKHLFLLKSHYRTKVTGKKSY